MQVLRCRVRRSTPERNQPLVAFFLPSSYASSGLNVVGAEPAPRSCRRCWRWANGQSSIGVNPDLSVGALIAARSSFASRCAGPLHHRPAARASPRPGPGSDTPHPVDHPPIAHSHNTALARSRIRLRRSHRDHRHSGSHRGALTPLVHQPAAEIFESRARLRHT